MEMSLGIFLAVSVLSGCMSISGVSAAGDFDRYKPHSTPRPQSDFDRAVQDAPDRARQSPAYAPPDPHGGRLQIPDTDVSVGGGMNPANTKYAHHHTVAFGVIRLGFGLPNSGVREESWI